MAMASSSKTQLSPTGSLGAGGGDQEAASQERFNLRTCGRETVPNQAPRRNLSKKHGQSVPTIPSRFEVTLYKGNREFKGFNSRSMRFEANRPSEVPGPGQYGLKKTFFQENEEKPGWGIRGTGGFASRSRRFGIRSMPSMPPAGLGCPGPGAYEPLGALRLAKDSKDFNQAGATAVFNPSKTTSKAGSASKLEPGPGQYNARLLPDARQAAAAQSAFRSTSTRGPSMAVSDEPGPGEYYDGTDRPVGWVAPHLDGLDLRYAQFKEPSKPHIAKVHQDLPPASEQARGVLGEFSKEVCRPCLGTVGLAATLPGPGHYDQDRDGMWKGNPTGVNGHGSFQPGAKRTDWAPAEVGLLPGPGKYEPKKVSPDTLTSAASAFVSTSSRGKYQFPQAPGPAYYSVSLPKHKSFRLKDKEFITGAT
eukprot:TRINITY_DN19696_c0_g1_i1.p1 TRINITY_DN19696_c0_g1~~TRINITY_DN19696_c0_g1_i1.p1  ORF type:complete len:428 (-),score=69.03 TRINITY_DN19696_c0_g1_i1:84-1343(-)